MFFAAASADVLIVEGRSTKLRSSVRLVAQGSCTEQAVTHAVFDEQTLKVGADYPRQVPRETLAPYVPLPHFRGPGMSFELGEVMFPPETVPFCTK